MLTPRFKRLQQGSVLVNRHVNPCKSSEGSLESTFKSMQIEQMFLVQHPSMLQHRANPHKKSNTYEARNKFVWSSPRHDENAFSDLIFYFSESPKDHLRKTIRESRRSSPSRPTQTSTCSWKMYWFVGMLMNNGSWVQCPPQDCKHR
jgi:hypothetical protein